MVSLRVPKLKADPTYGESRALRKIQKIRRENRNSVYAVPRRGCFELTPAVPVDWRKKKTCEWARREVDLRTFAARRRGKITVVKLTCRAWRRMLSVARFSSKEQSPVCHCIDVRKVDQSQHEVELFVRAFFFGLDQFG